MKTTTFHTLVVDNKEENASKIQEVLKPQIEFAECDYTNNLFKALELLSGKFYNLCLISDNYNTKELKSFFTDSKKVGKDKNCVFVQVRDSIDIKFDRNSLNTTGFVTVVSRQGTQFDKAALIDASKGFMHAGEVAKRVIDIESAMKILLHEIDRAARGRKRGKNSKLDSIAMGLIDKHTAFDEEVLGRYYESLQNASESIKPEAGGHIEIPAEIQKGLPNINEGTYTGASDRVFKKLHKRFGVKGDKANGNCKKDKES